MTDRFTGQAQFQVEWSLFLANPPPPTSTRQAGLYLQWADARMLKTALAAGYCGLRDCSSAVLFQTTGTCVFLQLSCNISDNWCQSSPCTSPDGSYCMEEKRNALRTGDESGIPIFVPECREDGGYKQVQCHKGNNPQPPTTYTHILIPTHKRRFTKILYRYWLLLVCHRGRKTSTRIICSTFKGFMFHSI